MFSNIEVGMKQLILHIGMGKCGSTSIQKFLSEVWHPEVQYIKYPGEIDANPIIADYIDLDNVPVNVIAVLTRIRDRSITQAY